MVAASWHLLGQVLAHHDPDAAQNAEGIRAWLGQAWVHQGSVTLHATGALLVAAGLAAVLLMRSLRSGEGWTAWSDANRGWVRLAVMGGWGLNFLGGVMRLFEPDHPGLASIGEYTWVQVLVLKHVALLGAIVFSLLAIEMGPERWTRSRLRQHAAIALVLVLFASVSGGVASGLPLPDMDDDDEAMFGEGDMHQDGSVVTWRNATMAFTGANPLTPRTQTLDLQVPDNASEVWVSLEWQIEQSSFWVELVGPDGTVRQKSGNVTPTTAEVAVDKELTPGTWTIRIRSDLATNEVVSVATRLTQGHTGIRVLEETVTIRSGFEINLYMDEGDYFNYTWSLATGDPAIFWDIHSHPDDDTVDTHHEGTDTSAEGDFTAGPHEVYSIYWRPAAGQVVTLTYRVEGNFTVHSIYR